MTLQKLKTILDTTGFPVAYSHFIKTDKTPLPSPPYITYLEIDSSNFKADNKVYSKGRNVHIELYTKKKDLDSEKIVEDVLDSNEIAYESDETYIDSEKIFQKIYEVRLI